MIVGFDFFMVYVCMEGIFAWIHKIWEHSDKIKL